MLHWLARVGYAARGVVYIVIGGLVAAAIDDHRPLSVGSALSIVTDLPLGHVALGLIALGLFAYAAFRLAQGLLGRHVAGAGGLATRAGMLGSAGLHAVIGFVAATLAVDASSLIGGTRTGIAEQWAVAALDWPLGRWLVAGIGIGAVLMGLGQIARARGSAFQDINAAAPILRAVRIVGRAGLAAKGLVFGLTGAFFLTAAWQAEAEAAGGLRAALAALAGAPLGDWLVRAVAVGLLAYGVFSLAKAWLHQRPVAGSSRI